MRALRFAAMLFSLCIVPAVFAAQDSADKDKDHTLQAMKDEMARAKSRLELAIPPSNQPVRPYYVEYRLLDMDIREVVGEFGALVSTGHNRTRLMNVGARVGDYKLDSSNFIGDENFRGFIGPSGSVGIDRDYDSLRQDLWIATDQAFKEAVETYSRKQAYLSSLARPSDIEDFSRVQVIQHVDPLPTSDWSNRHWEQEVRDTSAALRAFPDIYESRVTYYLVYLTEYLLTSEGTELRTNRSYAAIEAPMSTLAADGMELNHFYATYAPRPADLPSVDAVRKDLNVAGSELMGMRAAPPASDYTGPVLFESRAAAALIAQVLGPSLNGARPPVAFQPVVDQLMNSLGARSDWSGKIDSRVLPLTVSLVDDPLLKDYKGTPLIGTYAIDEEGVPAQKVTLVENGTLVNYLVSRQPIRDFPSSNGHGRAGAGAFPAPNLGVLLVKSSDAQSPEALKQRVIQMITEQGKPYGYRVETLGPGNSPRLLYRIYPDGHEELVRGAVFNELDVRALRSDLMSVGNDPLVSNRAGGIATTVISPSLLFDELEVKRADTSKDKLPDYPPPPQKK